MGKSTNRDLGRLEGLLHEAGLPLPPMPVDANARLKEREEWSFSTRTFKVSPFDLAHHVRKAIGGASPDHVLVARTGPEPDRAAMHYYLVQGPLQIFLQVGCGRTPGEQARAAESIVRTFALAHDLVAAVPRALHRGKLSRAGRLTVVGSDLAESFWEVAEGEERGSRPGRQTEGRRRDISGVFEVLSEAIAWCRAKG
jgi:hypothetical protein